MNTDYFTTMCIQVLCCFILMSCSSTGVESKKEIVHEDGTISLEYRNANGYLTKLEDYNPDKEMTLQVLYLYDIHGNNIERKILLPTGKQRGRLEFKYDEYGRKIEQIEFNENNDIVYTHIYKKNSDGTTEEKIYDAKGIEIKNPE